MIDLRVKKIQAIKDPPKDKYPFERICDIENIKQYKKDIIKNDKLLAWKRDCEGVTKIDIKI